MLPLARSWLTFLPALVAVGLERPKAPPPPTVLRGGQVFVDGELVGEAEDLEFSHAPPGNPTDRSVPFEP